MGTPSQSSAPTKPLASPISAANIARLSARVVVLVVLLGALLLLPIWLVRFLPLLDYPNHLARAFVLAHLHDPTFEFSKFYRADWGFYPYLGMDVSLTWLQHFFPVELAGRIFVSLCVLALPVGAWFFMREANPGHSAVALWALLIAYNVFFLEGFLNFDLGVALCLVTLGLWLRYLARPRAWRWGLTLVVCSALYFAHLLAFGLAGLVGTVYVLLARRKLRELILTWLLFLPGVLVYLRSSRLGLEKGPSIVFRGFADKIVSLSAFMHGYSARLDQLTLLALAAYFLLAWWRNKDFRWNYAWLGVAAFLFALYWALPYAYGEGSDLDIRVFPVLFVVILVVAKIGPRQRWLALLPLVLFLLRTGNVAQYFLGEQPPLEGLARSFEVIPRDALVLPIVAGDEQHPIQQPFAHFWAYGVIRRGWFSPYLSDIPGATPLRIVYDSYTPDGFWDLQPPDWAQVQQDYDYVWAYGVPQFSSALASIGERVYQFGQLQVFRIHKGSSGTTDGPEQRVTGTPPLEHTFKWRGERQQKCGSVLSDVGKFLRARKIMVALLNLLQRAL